MFSCNQGVLDFFNFFQCIKLKACRKRGFVFKFNFFTSRHFWRTLSKTWLFFVKTKIFLIDKLRNNLPSSWWTLQLEYDALTRNWMVLLVCFPLEMEKNRSMLWGLVIELFSAPMYKIREKFYFFVNPSQCLIKLILINF